MPLSFSSFQEGPATGKAPESLVVLLHGYGDRGDHFLSLSHHWTSLLPKTVFVAPSAPMVCEEHGEGKQWFSLRDWDPHRIFKEIKAVIPDVNQYLDSLLKEYNLPAHKMALVGFSQGAMMALQIAISRPPFAGVVAYAGALFDDLQDVDSPQTPLLLVHGMEDHVVPFASSQNAEKTLKERGAPVSLSLLPHLDHTMDERGLALGASFLKTVLKDS